MCNMSRFIRDQKGAVTVEFTVLVPFFVLLLVFFADASVIYLTHSEMYKVARDAARRVSTRELTNTDEVREFAAQYLFLGNRTYTVRAAFGQQSIVSIEVPISEAAIFGLWFKPVLGGTLDARAIMSRELELTSS